MAFLRVLAADGVTWITVSVAYPDGAAEEPEHVGDRDRMFDGTFREVTDGYKRSWPITTAAMTVAEYNTLRNALLGTQPLSCDGDLLGGAVSCHAELGRTSYIGRGGTLRRLLFTLRER